MHGRRRADIPILSAEKLESQRQKVRLGFELIQQLLRQRASGVHTAEALRSTRKLIEFNPELSTIWNYRREVLTTLLEQRHLDTEAPKPLSCQDDSVTNNGIKRSSSNGINVAGVSGEGNEGGANAACSNSSDSTCCFCQRDRELSQLLREELQLTASGLTKGASKAYCLWLHRSWTLARLVAREYERHTFHLTVPHLEDCQGAASSSDRQQELQKQQQPKQHAGCSCCGAPCLASSHPDGRASVKCGLDGALELLQEELDACEKLIKDVDGRNFHCWQHRSMVLVWQAAFIQYKQTQCGYRGPERHSSTDFDFSNYSAWHLRSLLPDIQKQAIEEFAWLWQGIYTEPTDQSLWQYYTWLLTGSGGVRAGRVLTVRGAVSSSGVPTFYFFFAEPCALDAPKCRVETLSSETQLEEATSTTEVAGEWKLLSPLYTQRVSGFTSTLVRRNPRQLSRVWIFTANEESSSGITIEKLRVHLALTLYAGPVSGDGSGIDAFHLQRLTCYAPQLAALASPGAHRRSQKSRETEEPSRTNVFDISSSSTEARADTDTLLWKCLTILQTNAPPEVQRPDCAALRLWAVSDVVTCTGCCCLCTAEEGSLTGTGADAEAVSVAESVAAAGGSLSEGLSLAIAQQELNNIEELLQLEAHCKGAIDAKLRLLRVLRPHAFAEYVACCSALMAVDAAHERMHRDDAVSAAVREKIWKRKCQSGTSLLVSSALEESNIERLPYPLLLEATDVQELSLRDNPLTNEAMLEWHVPYLPLLRRLDIRGTKISRLSLLLLSVAQLPHLEREIDVTGTPLAASLTNGSLVFKCFELVRVSEGSEVGIPTFLRRVPMSGEA